MNHEKVNILMVEDNPGDVELMRIGFEMSNFDGNFHQVGDGKEALEYLFNEGNFTQAVKPDVILLDINLPKVNGLKVLEKIKSDPRTEAIPVILVTSSEANEDVWEGYRNHANGYIVKSMDVKKLKEMAESIEYFWKKDGHFKGLLDKQR